MLQTDNTRGELQKPLLRRTVYCRSGSGLVPL